MSRMTTAEMTDGLRRLSEVMREAQFRQWADWCQRAIEELQQRKEVTIVTHTNYADGEVAYAFWSDEDAKKEVAEDAAEIMCSLKEQGYEPKFLESEDKVEIYAADSNIYYEWYIERDTIIEERSGSNENHN